MSLNDRLTVANIPTQELGPADLRVTEVNELKRRLHERLVEAMSEEIARAGGDTDTARRSIERRIDELLQSDGTPMSQAEKKSIAADLLDEVVGYGPIQPFLDDATITEVMVNNAETIYVEREGLIRPTERRFIDEAHLLRVIDKIVARVGRRVDESVPMVDARLPDGSRVNAIIHPLAINGPMLTIRKFSAEPFTIEDMVAFGTVTPTVATFLSACVRGRMNILISGGTGAGKTTLLNVVSSFVPNDERIVTIEDAAELRLSQEHVLRLESRPPNIEGKGQVTIRDLVRNSLRMRPDRIIVGEVRGAEALDMLQAMNTGHDGSLSTIHSNSPRDALRRLETMVLMAGYDLPIRAIREQVSSAMNLVVHMARLRDGARRVTKVSEIQGMEGDTVVMEDIFVYDFSAGVDDEGRFLGKLRATGLRPKISQRLEEVGVKLPAETFAYEPPVGG